MEEVKHGGARENAGRKAKADEEKVTVIFTKALKELYSVDTDDEAKSKFVKDVVQMRLAPLHLALLNMKLIHLI